jgi:hypothetical protein
LPINKLTALTLLVLEINCLIDTGKYDNITLKNIENNIKNETIFEYLKETAKDDIDLSLLMTDSSYAGFRKYYYTSLHQIYAGYAGNERRKWGIEKKDLCLLLAWTNEIIQQGSGLSLCT